VPSATVPATQVGIVVRTDEGDKAKKPEGGGEQQSASSGPADTAVVGAVARRRILANEPISPDQLIQRGDRSIGSAVVSPGMRAVSIKIKPETASGGFIAPGDYVDVLLSIAHQIKVVGPDGKAESAEGMAVTLPDGDSMVKYTTETVMRNVRVLAIDQSLARAEDAGPADVGKTATVEVSPQDAEKLLTAGQLGSLTLVLRSLVVDKADQDEADAFEDPFNFMSDVATSRAVSALHTTSNLYGGGTGGPGVRVNRGGAISQEGY
jgi:pilus assembly protein CpaB